MCNVRYNMLNDETDGEKLTTYISDTNNNNYDKVVYLNNIQKSIKETTNFLNILKIKLHLKYKI